MQTQSWNTISVRDFLRDYKTTFNKVATSGSPVVVTTRQKPKVAVVDLITLGKLQKASRPNTAQALLELAREGERIAKKYKVNYPKDLSTNHDKYAWGSYG